MWSCQNIELYNDVKQKKPTIQLIKFLALLFKWVLSLASCFFSFLLITLFVLVLQEKFIFIYIFLNTYKIKPKPSDKFYSMRRNLPKNTYFNWITSFKKNNYEGWFIVISGKYSLVIQRMCVQNVVADPQRS